MDWVPIGVRWGRVCVARSTLLGTLMGQGTQDNCCGGAAAPPAVAVPLEAAYEALAQSLGLCFFWPSS